MKTKKKKKKAFNPGDSIPEFHYRYNHHPYENSAYLLLRTFRVVRETPKGYWLIEISPHWYYRGDDPKWVPKESLRRFAYPTQEEALNSYVHRTTSRVKHLERQITKCQQGLRRAAAKKTHTTIEKNKLKRYG